jgi:hypothetical protein
MGYLESFHSFGNNTAAGYKWVSGAPFLVAAAKLCVRKTVPRLQLICTRLLMVANRLVSAKSVRWRTSPTLRADDGLLFHNPVYG